MQNQYTKPDFSGQDIYFGMDVGLRGWKVAIMTRDLEHRVFTQPPEVDVLVNYLHRNFPGGRYHGVYEAGYCGFWIHDGMRERGIDCMVANPADVPTKHKEKAHKSNCVDARKLVRSLMNGELEPIYVPSRGAMEDRSLTRSRHAFVKKQTRVKNQIKALLAQYGITVPEGETETHWSRKYVAYLEQLKFQRPSGDQTLKSLLEELVFQRGMIARLTKQIRALALEEPYRASAGYLQSVCGLSIMSGMIFLTELIDINRFGTLDGLASYCGLVPGEHSTGDDQTITGITSRRNPMLRGLLTECAWVAARKDPALHLAFNKLAARMPKNKAIIRIARKLLNRIRFVLKNQKPYEMCVAQTTR